MRDKVIIVAKIAKHYGYQRGPASMTCKFIDKKVSGGTVENENISNKELSEELHKPIIKKFRERTVESPLVDNISGADLTDMQLITKFKEGICFLLCLIDVFSKYVWVILLNDKSGLTITNAFQKILDESNCKPNKIWVDNGSEFCYRSMKS